MRFALIVAAAIVSGCAGVPPGMQQISDADRTFDGVFEVPGYSKDQIFTATKIWLAEHFRSSKSVIEYENKDDGTLIGNGVIRYPCSGLECVAKSDWSVPFTMRVDMKDQKFKLTFSNVRISWPPSYNRTFGAQPGRDGPINLMSDLDAIKPKLLDFGGELATSIRTNSVSKNW